METEEQIEKNRKNIDNWFKGRFVKDRQLKEYKGFKQGSYVDVDFSVMSTRKFKGIDVLMIIAIIPQNDTFIGMTGSMDLCQVPLFIIKNIKKQQCF